MYIYIILYMRTKCASVDIVPTYVYVCLRLHLQIKLDCEI